MPVLNKSMMLTVAAVFICAGTTSVQAVTCEDVRSLSRAEQEYWSKQLNLTREQRHQIWQACYGRFRSGRAAIPISKSAE
jgi:Spy/CpxP family protein refolding chaperone